MAGDRGIVPKHGILRNDFRIPGAHSLEKDSQMIEAPARFGIGIDHRFGFLLRQLGVVIEMPLLFVRLAHGFGIALLIPAGVVILPVLWSDGDRASVDLQQAACSIILRALVTLAGQHELHDHLHPRVIVNDVVNVGVFTAMIFKNV